MTWLGAGVLVSCAALFALHTPQARGILVKLGGCPMGRASATQVEEARRVAALPSRGEFPAPVRPAAGFMLDVTTRGAVDDWAARYEVSCQEKREGALLLCADVPPRAIGRPDGVAIAEVAFAFTPRPALRLVNLTVMHRPSAANAAVRELVAVTAALHDALGAPIGEAGERTAAHVGALPYATAAVAYRFRDYFADVSSTNLPRQGVMLYEHYMSVPD